MSRMIPIEPEDWLEKRFEFALPVEAFPLTVERVRGTPARLEEMVRSLPAGILTTRTGDARSIQEHVGHLCDLDELHEGRRLLANFREGTRFHLVLMGTPR